jgi:hypothetical protein
MDFLLTVFAMPGRQRKEMDDVPRGPRFLRFLFYECAVNHRAAKIAQRKKAGEMRRPLIRNAVLRVFKTPLRARTL